MPLMFTSRDERTSAVLRRAPASLREKRTAHLAMIGMRDTIIETDWDRPAYRAYQKPCYADWCRTAIDGERSENRCTPCGLFLCPCCAGCACTANHRKPTGAERERLRGLRAAPQTSTALAMAVRS
jgi:hypothetical protein